VALKVASVDGGELENDNHGSEKFQARLVCL
jgi:hypothetical protein